MPDEPSKIQITIAGLNRTETRLEIDLNEIKTVKDLKEVICKNNNYPESSLNLIKTGFQLKDHQTLAEHQIVNGSKIFAVIKKKQDGSSPKQNQQHQSNNVNSSNSSPNNNIDSSNPLFSNLMGSQMPGMNLESMADFISKNPEMMSAIIKSNPQLQKMFDKNPHIAQIFQNPEMLSQIMSGYSSKAAADQMNFQNDVTLSNLESMGYMNQIQRVHDDLNDALTNFDEPNTSNTEGSEGNRNSSNTELASMLDKTLAQLPKTNLKKRSQYDFNKPEDVKSLEEVLSKSLSKMVNANLSHCHSYFDIGNESLFARTCRTMHKKSPNNALENVFNALSTSNNFPLPTGLSDEEIRAKTALLQSMGFTDESKMKEALAKANGDVGKAIDYLTRGPNNDN
ncbi:MAG: hypothetical protein MHPSP_000865 [Paramarteilia canceri]